MAEQVEIHGSGSPSQATLWTRCTKFSPTNETKLSEMVYACL